jgi:hypothetical protein
MGNHEVQPSVPRFILAREAEELGLEVIIVQADARAGKIAVPSSEGTPMTPAQIFCDSQARIFRLATADQEATEIRQDQVGNLVMRTDGDTGEPRGSEASKRRLIDGG